VGQFWDDITRAYDQHIQVPGKETHFLILLAFVFSFAFIRTSTHMIRAQVSWWPGNVETKSGVHVHHMFWGILLLISMGYVGLAIEIPDPWFEITAVIFGVGMGLTMDEFALWLNLEDVYWQKKGKESIRAVVVTAGMLLIGLIGLQFWIDLWDAVIVFTGFGRGNVWIAVPIQLIGVALAIVCFRRGRKLIGIVGVFIPLVAFLGVVVPRRRAPARSSA
jgi:hypothetical protein